MEDKASYELTDEQRAAAEGLSESDNPLAPIAEMLVQLDDNASSSESTHGDDDD
ncbi:hypothetical protein [Halorubrum salsamenti]|uniref:hypothetical protein n=1 Tax=Halorubrum salsamenti TaxID=2583990 RepID=UPI0016434D4B|nr:hypothetical protein [Halorubrum salsamenti]